MASPDEQCDGCNGAGGWCALCTESPENCDCGDPERDHWTECHDCDGTGTVDDDDDDSLRSGHHCAPGDSEIAKVRYG